MINVKRCTAQHTSLTIAITSNRANLKNSLTYIYTIFSKLPDQPIFSKLDVNVQGEEGCQCRHGTESGVQAGY